MVAIESYNNFDIIDSYSERIVDHLITSERAEDLWKLLKYASPDALKKPRLTQKEKAELIWNNQETDSSKYNVFMTPMLDDLQYVGNTMLRVYLGDIYPDNNMGATVDIHFHIISHAKLMQLSDYKSRTEVILKLLLQSLNGQRIGGLGRLFFNRNGSPRNRAQLNLSNNKNYSGYLIVMSLKCGGDDLID